MAVWKYYKGLGEHNPLCVDVGQILSIAPYCEDGTGFIIKTDDGDYCGGCIKPYFIAVSGYCDFGRTFRFGRLYKEFPRNLEDGMEVEWPEDVEWNGMNGASCCDPRALYLANKVWRLIRTKNVPDAEWDELYSTIPTKEFALKWLKDNGYETKFHSCGWLDMRAEAKAWDDKDNERWENS